MMKWRERLATGRDGELSQQQQLGIGVDEHEVVMSRRAESVEGQVRRRAIKKGIGKEIK